MAKQIKFEYKDKEYTLEFDRTTIKTMESRGIYLADFQERVVTAVDSLFAYAFYMHHKNVKKEQIEEMYTLFKNKEKLFEALSEMAVQSVETLFEEPNEKNAIEWEMN